MPQLFWVERKITVSYEPRLPHKNYGGISSKPHPREAFADPGRAY